MFLRPQTPIEEIAPYVVPEYWDNKVLSVHPVPHGEFGPPTHRHEARDLLEHKIASLYGRDYRPLRQFKQGQTFDANELTPGTVIRMRHEFAHSKSPTDELAQSYEPAERPSPNLSQKIGSQQIGHFLLKSRGVRYELNDAWGIILPGDGKRNTLFTVPDLFVRRNGPEARVLPLSMMRFVPSKFEVGAVVGVRKFFGGEVSPKQYQRVIAVDEVGPSGHKRRQPVKALLEKFVLQPPPEPVPIPIKNN